MEQPQCGSSSVAAAAVWQRQQCGVAGSPVRGSIGVTVSAWRCDSSGRAAVVCVASSAYKQPRRAHVWPMWRERCGSIASAAVWWQQRQKMAAAGRSRPGVINQGVARAFARVRRPGVLTFAAVSVVGVSGRRNNANARSATHTTHVARGRHPGSRGKLKRRPSHVVARHRRVRTPHGFGIGFVIVDQRRRPPSPTRRARDRRPPSLTPSPR